MEASPRRRRRTAFGITAIAGAAGLLLCLTPGWAAAGANQEGPGVSAPVEVPAKHAQALAAAWRQVEELGVLVSKHGVVPDFGRTASAIVDKALKTAGASGGEATGLEQAVDAPLLVLFQEQLQSLAARAADRYEEAMSERPNPLQARNAAKAYFEKGAKALLRQGSDWSYEAMLQDLMSRLADSISQDSQLIAEQGKQGQGKHVTIEVIRKLQQQSAAVQREVETRGAFPWNVKWQYMLDKSPLGFRGQYAQGRSIVELLLMPSPDPRLKKNLLNRIGPLNLAVAFDMLL